jgi:aminoglycoside phosphotransferase
VLRLRHLSARPASHLAGVDSCPDTVSMTVCEGQDPTLASATVAASADLAARHLARELSLPEPALLRRGGNAVYQAGDTVLRVSPDRVSAERQRRLAEWLAARGYPVMPAVSAHDVAGLDVSLWQRVDNTGRPDMAVVADALRRLHQEARAAVELVWGSPLKPMFPSEFDKVRERLTEPAAWEVFYTTGLSAAVAALDDVEERLRADTRVVVVHGDMQPTNLLAGRDGTWLIDFELLCVAPALWDLAKIAMFAERFDADGFWHHALLELLGRYGDIDRELLTAWTTFALVATTAGCVAKRAARPELGEEASCRLRWWAGEPDAPVWRFL